MQWSVLMKMQKMFNISVIYGYMKTLSRQKLYYTYKEANIMVGKMISFKVTDVFF